MQFYILVLDNEFLTDWLSLIFTIICYMTAGSINIDVTSQLSVTLKSEDPSLLDINNHLRPENTIITKELVKKFKTTHYNSYFS